MKNSDLFYATIITNTSKLVLVKDTNSNDKLLQTMPVNTTLQRKKSLPDVQGLPKQSEPMSREEASVLSHARREELRRMNEEAEKLRANPLLYLVSPGVKVSCSLYSILVKEK